MSAYMIIEVKEIMDKGKYGEYVQKVPQTVLKFGGKYLARSGQVKAVTGIWNPSQLIIIEFESMDKFNAWQNSPEYQAVVPLREKSAKTNAVVVEGV